jgi:twitching motility protein PilT
MQDLFALMVERRASHFHVVPGSPIMMRTNGVLVPMDNRLLSPADTAMLVESFLTEEQRYYFQENKDLNISQSVPGLSRFRVNIFQQRGSVACVIATHPPSPPTIDELGLPELLKGLALNLRQGLVIICGPRGGGKSATLAAMVNYLLEMRTCQVISLENPIDYLHKNKKGIICQREIGTDTLSYESAIESLVHQQPDVLVTTELETYELVSTVVNMAAGGTLCICTTRQPSVGVLLEHLLNLYPPHLRQQAQTLLSVSLEAVIAQVLLNKASGTGMVPAFEIMMGIPSVRGMIREGKTGQISSIMSTSGREFGMQTQEQALRQLVKKNIVTQDEALSKSVRPEEFKKLMSLPY